MIQRIVTKPYTQTTFQRITRNFVEPIKCRSFSNGSNSKLILGESQAKEAARRIKREELLMDLDRLQQKAQKGNTAFQGDRSWSDAVRDTVKVAKPELINILATFMMVVMSMQVYASRQENKEVIAAKEVTQKELDDINVKVQKLRSPEFSERLGQRISNKLNDQRGTTQSSWFFSKTKNTDSISTNLSSTEMASIIRNEIVNIIGETSVDNDEKQIDQTKMLIDELVASTKTSSSIGEDKTNIEEEVVSIEGDKVIKRKRFIL